MPQSILPQDDGYDGPADQDSDDIDTRDLGRVADSVTPDGETDGEKEKPKPKRRRKQSGSGK